MIVNFCYFFTQYKLFRSTFNITYLQVIYKSEKTSSFGFESEKMDFRFTITIDCFELCSYYQIAHTQIILGANKC